MRILKIYIDKVDTKIILRFAIFKIFSKLKWLFKYNFENNSKALTQDEILVAIGIIMNPTLLKNNILIEILMTTETKE